MGFWLFRRYSLIGYPFTFIHKFIQEILFSYHAPFFRAHGILLMVFVLLIAAGMVFRRYWCRNICPMGPSLRSFQTGQYSRGLSHHHAQAAVCVLKAVAWCDRKKKKKRRAGHEGRRMHPVHDLPEDMSGKQYYLWDQTTRRTEMSSRPLKTGIFISGLIGAATTPFLKLNYTKSINKGKTSIIRPPGAVDEKISLHFVYGAASV